jgi:hypothetical protein
MTPDEALLFLTPGGCLCDMCAKAREAIDVLSAEVVKHANLRADVRTYVRLANEKAAKAAKS